MIGHRVFTFTWLTRATKSPLFYPPKNLKSARSSTEGLSPRALVL